MFMILKACQGSLEAQVHGIEFVLQTLLALVTAADELAIVTEARSAVEKVRGDWIAALDALGTARSSLCSNPCTICRTTILARPLFGSWTPWQTLAHCLAAVLVALISVKGSSSPTLSSSPLASPARKYRQPGGCSQMPRKWQRLFRQARPPTALSGWGLLCKPSSPRFIHLFCNSVRSKSSSRRSSTRIPTWTLDSQRSLTQVAAACH